ncbi:transposase [Kitasatospora sp. NPDC101447]|uniref:transposase n=1 Tax=Kitasatospora sp. NPDC101447 TaxID=3364102 RepID=UPI00380D4E89
MTERRRYPLDLKDEQWVLIEPCCWSGDAPAPKGVRPIAELREVVNTILYVARAGIAWRYLPHDFPPHTTIYGYFKEWERDGTAEWIHDMLRDQMRAKKRCRILPTAAIVDAQAVKASPNR